MEHIPDYNVQVKVRNNYLLHAMRQKGIHTANELARQAGVAPLTMYNFLNLKQSPFTNRHGRKGELSPAASKMEKFLGVPVEYLFPENHLYTPLEKNIAETEMSFDQVEEILSWDGGIMQEIENDALKDSINRALSALTPKEQEIIVRRHGLNGHDECTLEEIAKERGVSRERIRQIEAKAYTKMRHPGAALKTGMNTFAE